MQCNMCYVRVDQEAIKQSGKRERTVAEWINMAEQAAEAGTLNLLLTGGEVTLRPDFCDIYEAIIKMGFVTTVYTNATNINDQIMALFEKYPPHTVGVTMYGASSDTYQKICGHADGFDRFVRGLRKLRSLPSVLETRTTLVKKNIDDYQAMKDFIEQELGPNQTLRVSVDVYNSIRGSVCDPTKERLDPLENCAFFYKWLDNLYWLLDEEKLQFEEVIDVQKLRETEIAIKRRTLGEDGTYLFNNCGAGISEYFISWAGDMYACGMLPIGCTHPFDEGFTSAWDRLPDQYPKTKVNNKCRNCSLMPYCDSCPAFRIVETGSWDGIPQRACEKAYYLRKRLEPLFQRI